MENNPAKQIFVEIELGHGDPSLAQILSETALYEREYENDKLLVHQILNISSTSEKHSKFLVIFNLYRDSNHFGEKISY